MKQNENYFRNACAIRRMGGLGLLDVVLAIAIFAFGMLALVQLQGNLARSSADANQRTVATSIAEELIERLRTFEQVSPNAANDAQDIWEYLEMQSDSALDRTVSRGSIDYTVDVTVQDFWWDEANETFIGTETPDPPPGLEGLAYSDFKQLRLDVNWGAQVAYIDDGKTGDLGTGSITLYGVIPSSPALLGARVIAEEAEGSGPIVTYLPGEAPDVIRIPLTNDRYKESSVPEPELDRGLMETWFDVVTYSGAGEIATFLRREEFVAIECDCELREDGEGFGPAVWTGSEYKVGEMIPKAYGVRIGNDNDDHSLYCDACCRDHHDSDTGYKVKTNYNGNGDHPHYFRGDDGTLIEATPAETGCAKGGNQPECSTIYVEACRMVRKDGFFRVAQDVNLHENNAFPGDYLTATPDVMEYQDYIMAIVDSALKLGTAPAAANEVLTFTGRNDVERLAVVAEYPDNPQPLRSRALYFDEPSTELVANVENCFGEKGVRSKCESAGALSIYELYPFFELQITRLARWATTVQNKPVAIWNEDIPKQVDVKTGELKYKRGGAFLQDPKTGLSTGHSIMETGNVGLISTDPIALVPASENDIADIWLVAGDGTTPGGGGNLPIILGALNAAGGTSTAADLSILGAPGENLGAVQCNKPGNLVFECTVDASLLGGATPTLTVSNYYNKNFALIICGSGLTYLEHHNGTDQTTDKNWTRFLLPLTSTSGITLTVNKGTDSSVCQ